MSKLTLTDISNLQNENTIVAAINANNAATEAAMDQALFRDGTSPNAMSASLDMNSNRILNLPDAINLQEPATLAQLEDVVLAAGNGKLTVNSSPIVGGTSGGILFNNGGVVSNTDSFGSANLLTSGTLSIAIPTGSVSRGINISQSVPSTAGTQTGAIFSNIITSIMDTVISGPGDPGTPSAANWSAFQVSASIGSNFNTQHLGLDTLGQAYGISVGLVTNSNTTTRSDIVGLSAGTATNNRNTRAHFYGATVAATVGEQNGTFPLGGSCAGLIGLEIGVSQNNIDTASVPYRYGLNIDNYGTNVASGIDTAISIMGGNTGGSWKRGITFTNPGGGLAPALTTTGIMFGSEITMTVDTIFDWSNVTASSYILRSPNSSLTGNGILTLGSPTITTGGLSFNGTAGANLSFLVGNYNSVPKWVLGGTSTIAYFSAVGAGVNAWQVDNATNVMSTLSGLTVGGNLTLNGSTSGSLILLAPAVAGSNTIRFPAGSTNFTGTGGTGQVVKQSTAGGGFTVATVGIDEVSGLGTGIATFLATPSSANLFSAMTDKTGSGGSLVFATSPTLTTPTLGIATATSVNKVALTAPATSATLTIADGKTLTCSNTLTFTGTDTSSVAFGTGGTVVYSGGAASFTTVAASTSVTVTSNSASALTVGRLGATTPAFTVDSSTGTQVAGLKVTGAVTGGTVAVVTTDSGSNANLTIDAKGSGTIGIAPTSTGRVTITPVTTITGALTLSALGLVYDSKTLTGSTGTGKMVLDGTPTLTTPILGAATATSINFGGTSLANYVEGTWTPAVTTDGTVGTPAYTSQTGVYTRIGRIVLASFAIQLSGWTGSPTGNVSITGLPVTNSANVASGSISFFSIASAPASSAGLTCRVVGSSSVVIPYTMQATTITQLTAAQAGTTMIMQGSITYTV